MCELGGNQLQNPLRWDVPTQTHPKFKMSNYKCQVCSARILLGNQAQEYQAPEFKRQLQDYLYTKPRSSSPTSVLIGTRSRARVLTQVLGVKRKGLRETLETATQTLGLSSFTPSAASRSGQKTQHLATHKDMLLPPKNKVQGNS